MRLNDTLWGLLLVLFGAGVAFHARTFPAPAGHAVGPGLFPCLIGVGLALSGALLLWSGRTQRGAPRLQLEDWTREPRRFRNGVLVIGALIFYALAVDTMGFFVTAFVFLAALFLAFGVRARFVVPIAVVVALGLHLAFYTLLRVPLPWGWLEPVAW
jgi:putative tricarboxylic transport membrane protein